MDSFLTPLISAGISALVSYYVTIYTKDREYKNDYYKKVIDKRLVACENLEKFLIAMNFTATGPDKKTYFAVFADTTQFNSMITLMRVALQTGMWLGHNSQTQLQHLNTLIVNGYEKFDFSKREDSIEFAKNNYELMKSMRVKLVDFLKSDLFNMYDVPRFFERRG